MRPGFLRGAAFAAAAMGHLVAGAAELQPAQCPAIDNPAPPAAAASARIRAFIDPATGKLRAPTAEELRQIAEDRLRAKASAAPRVFDVVVYPDGTKWVDLQEAFLFDLVMEIRPDGSTGLRCVPRAVRPTAAPEK